MGQTLYELIPGLREAEDAFRDEQLEAFVGIEPPIAGVEVNPFTPRMLIELEGVGNGVALCDEAPSSADLAMFVWRISMEFNRRGGWRRALFLARFRRFVEYGPTVVACREYLHRAHAPRPSSNPVAKLPCSAWLSDWVHIFGIKYHWTVDQTMDTSFRILWQQMNRVREEADPKYRQVCNEALRLRVEYLKNLNAKN
jgi:hypothetical protein